MSTLEISQLLGNYGEFIGAIAVVSTLIYLSIQVRANTRSTRSQTLLEGSAQHQALLAAPPNSIDLRSALDKSQRGETLDASERIALTGWYLAMMNLLGSFWIQAEMGAFSRGAEYEGLKSAIQGFLATPSLESFVNSDEHSPFLQSELSRRYDQ